MLRKAFLYTDKQTVYMQSQRRMKYLMNFIRL